MKTLSKQFEIGQEVVRSKGDYVVGRIGVIKDLDFEKNRAQVNWKECTTWVSFPALELISDPYLIEPGYMNSKKKWINPKYKKI